MAPEVLSLNKYSEKADVYSFGIVLWEIFTGNRPYEDDEYRTMNQAQLCYHIVDKHARPSLQGLHPSLQQLISDCWDVDPRLRPSFSEAVIRLRRMKFEDTQSASSHLGPEYIEPVDSLNSEFDYHQTLTDDYDSNLTEMNPLIN